MLVSETVGERETAVSAQVIARSIGVLNGDAGCASGREARNRYSGEGWQ